MSKPLNDPSKRLQKEIHRLRKMDFIFAMFLKDMTHQVRKGTDLTKEQVDELTRQIELSNERIENLWKN